MDKEVVLHIHHGIFLSYRKKLVDELRAYYTQRSKSERERQISYINAYVWNLAR